VKEKKLYILPDQMRKIRALIEEIVDITGNPIPQYTKEIKDRAGVISLKDASYQEAHRILNELELDREFLR